MVRIVTILRDTVTTSWSADDIGFVILNISCWSDILVLYVFSSTLPVLACYMVAAVGWYNILLSCQGAMWTGP